MKNVIRNKRASVSSTITWIAATFVIIFILAVYIAFVGLLAVKKKTESLADFGTKSKEYSAGASSLVYADSIYGILKSRTASGKTVQEELEKSLDGYIDYRVNGNGQSIMEYVGDGDINSVELLYSPNKVYSSEIKAQFESQTGAKAKGKLIKDELQKRFNQFCPQYRLKIPQGIISEGDGELWNRERLNDDNLGISKEALISQWTGWRVFRIWYRGYNIEINLRMLNSCENAV